MDIRWTRARQLRNAPTDAERRLWYQLKGRRFLDVKFRRQYPVGPYIVDFVCCELALVVELDGGQHLDAAAYDMRRTIALERRGYRVLRFWNDEVLVRIDDVLEAVRRAVVWRRMERTPPQPSPAPQGREQITSLPADQRTEQITPPPADQRTEQITSLPADQRTEQITPPPAEQGEVGRGCS